MPSPFFPRILAEITGLALLLTASARCCQAANWPEFRGENGTAVSDDRDLPSQWNADQIRWRVDLPGLGHSAPVIWGDKVFLTSADDQGQQRYVLCLDAPTGERLWNRTLTLEPSAKDHRIHTKSSWASSTPALDGARLYFVFANADHQVLFAFDFDGKELWRRDVGSFESQHGQGSSPILFEDLVILANDQDGPSSIMAFEKRTGRPVWNVPRAFGSQSTSYATPMIYHPKGGAPQLICSSSRSGVSGLDPRTGKTIWSTNSLPQRTVASPVLAAGLIFQCCGSAGQGFMMVAVDPGGRGDVAKTHIRYERTKLLPYVPTPVAFANHLFLWSDHGIVCCLDPSTGNNIWTKRIGGDFSGSPICAGGTVINVDEQGNVVALAAASEFKLRGKFPLGEPSHSTPAVSNGRIYFRTFHHLACVTARP